jgi:putative acetyltransferase
MGFGGRRSSSAARQTKSEEVRVIVRPETDRDLDGIREVNIVAFQDHPYSQQTEHRIVEALRVAGALEVSLVAESDGEVVGHIAFSAAAIGGSSTCWFLLGPVAVQPARQGEGDRTRAGRDRS